MMKLKMLLRLEKSLFGMLSIYSFTRRNTAMEKKLSTREKVYYARLLVQTGIEKCSHEFVVDDYCMICSKVVKEERG